MSHPDPLHDPENELPEDVVIKDPESLTIVCYSPVGYPHQCDIYYDEKDNDKSQNSVVHLLKEKK